MKKKKILIITLIIILILAFAYWFKGYMAVDKCLDNGGRWNYKKSVCEYK
jgi:sensor domain CHASE-containing protein